MFQARWQFELEIVRHIISDPGAFEEALEGPLLILSNWLSLMPQAGFREGREAW
jgi:hypothetical protein